MEKAHNPLIGKENKQLVMPFITFLLFFASSVLKLIGGIEEQKKWQIFAASASALIFIGFLILITYTWFYNKKKALKAEGIQNSI